MCVTACADTASPRKHSLSQQVYTNKTRNKTNKKKQVHSYPAKLRFSLREHAPVPKRNNSITFRPTLGSSTEGRGRRRGGRVLDEAGDGGNKPGSQKTISRGGYHISPHHPTGQSPDNHRTIHRTITGQPSGQFDFPQKTCILTCLKRIQ